MDGVDDDLRAMGLGLVSMSIASDLVAHGSFNKSPVPGFPRKKVSESTFNTGIPFITYSPPEVSALSVMKIEKLLTLQFPYSVPPIPPSTNWHGMTDGFLLIRINQDPTGLPSCTI